MLALTLIQPWGTAILCGGKTVENRTWAPETVPEYLAIHAGRKYDIEAREPILALWPGLPSQAETPMGALLGVVRVAKITRKVEALTPGDRAWAVGPVFWVLRDPVLLPKPLPCRGAQGLWAVPEVHADAIARLLRPQASHGATGIVAGVYVRPNLGTVATPAATSCAGIPPASEVSCAMCHDTGVNRGGYDCSCLGGPGEGV